MIYLDGVASIIECIYLEEEFHSKSSICNIFVNPENIRYLIRKTIIINDPDYPVEFIDTLIQNSCKVISRVNFEKESVEFQPYILRINKNICWNGSIIDEAESLNDILEDGFCTFEDYQLYFPKIRIKKDNPVGPKTVDSFGNLSGLGWLLQQVGVNIIKDTPIKNLDIIKTGKVIFE